MGLTNTKKLSVKERILKALLDIKGNSKLIFRKMTGKKMTTSDLTDKIGSDEVSDANTSISTGNNLINFQPRADKIKEEREKAEKRQLEQKEKSAAAFASVSGKTGETMHAEAVQAAEKEQEKKERRSILESLKGIHLLTKEHHFDWRSIFSKKGLITGGALLLVPKLVKFIRRISGMSISNIISTALGGVTTVLENIWNFIQKPVNIVQDWWDNVKADFDHGLQSLKDGLNPLGALKDYGEKVDRIIEKLFPGGDDGDSKNDTAVSEFIYDENHEIDHNSGANAKLVAASIPRAVTAVTSRGETIKAGVDAFRAGWQQGGPLTTRLWNGISAVKTGVEPVLETTTKEVLTNESVDAAKAAVAKSGDDIAEKAVETGNKGIIKSAIEAVTNFASTVAEKVASVIGKRVPPKVTAWITKVTAFFSTECTYTVSDKSSCRI